MEKLIDTAVVKFNSNTIQDVRGVINVNQHEMEQMISNFEEWISKQSHFTKKNFDRQYLEMLIICKKGSLEKAKSTLDKMCTLKTLLPTYFCKYNVKKDLANLTGFVIHSTMPRLLRDNYRLVVLKLISSDFDSNMLLDLERFIVWVCEYGKRYDYNLGCTFLVDCRDVNLLQMISKVNILELRDCISLVVEGYGVRINGIHLLSGSKTIDALVFFLKQLLNVKLIGRIHIHKTVDTVYDHIPKESLPKDYGGDEQSVKTIHENWKDAMTTKEVIEFFKDTAMARTNEKFRLTTAYNTDILGMPGSFKTLTVD